MRRKIRRAVLFLSPLCLGLALLSSFRVNHTHSFPPGVYWRAPKAAAIGDLELRARARARLAKSAAAAGKFVLSTDVIAGIADPVARAEAIGQLAIALGAFGQPDLGRELAASIDDFVPAEVLAEIARALVAISASSDALMAHAGYKAPSPLHVARTRVVMDRACAGRGARQRS